MLFKGIFVTIVLYILFNCQNATASIPGHLPSVNSVISLPFQTYKRFFLDANTRESGITRNNCREWQRNNGPLKLCVNKFDNENKSQVVWKVYDYPQIYIVNLETNSHHNYGNINSLLSFDVILPESGRFNLNEPNLSIEWNSKSLNLMIDKNTFSIFNLSTDYFGRPSDVRIFQFNWDRFIVGCPESNQNDFFSCFYQDMSGKIVSPRFFEQFLVQIFNIFYVWPIG